MRKRPQKITQEDIEEFLVSLASDDDTGMAQFWLEEFQRESEEDLSDWRDDAIEALLDCIQEQQEERQPEKTPVTPNEKKAYIAKRLGMKDIRSLNSFVYKWKRDHKKDLPWVSRPGTHWKPILKKFETWLNTYAGQDVKRRRRRIAK